MNAPGPVNDFLAFLRHERKWWLIPLLVVLLLIVAVVFFAGGSQLAPFLYASS